jgi:diadenosine tetraphosphatase ApaH/serine/threonine PP2A family protein phosphatase
MCVIGTLPCALSVSREYDVLERLVELLPIHYHRKDPTYQRIPEGLIAEIVRKAREILMAEPNVVELDAPLYVCGDIHGQFYDLLNIFARRPPLGGRFFGDYLQHAASVATGSGGGAGQPPVKLQRIEPPPLEVAASAKPYGYLFLGDYVDRGSRGIECMVLLLSLKIIAPSLITLLRGNHEDEPLCRLYGFFDEVKRRYSVRLFRIFADLFRCLPVAALVGGSMLCMHGGIGPSLQRVEDIPDLRPCDVPHDGVICDLLWADPESEFPQNSDGWFAPSDRNISYVFSEQALSRFLAQNNLDLVCRAHQVMSDGYAFFPSARERKCLTLFSASNYCDAFDNRGAILSVSVDMTLSLVTFDPPSERQRRLIAGFAEPVLPAYDERGG